jgi:ankyrin repeat protein
MSAQDNGQQLIDVCKSGNFPGVRSLVGSGASVDFQDRNEETPAICSCIFGHPEILQYLLEQDANAELASKFGYRAIHRAAYWNKPECMTVLLRHGVVLDAVTVYGQTALWFASFNGYLPIVELLVEAGADIDRARNDGRTALYAAREQGHTAVAKYLSPAERKWRRVRAWAMVRSSVKGAQTDSIAMKVLQCDDMAREIQSYL